MLPLLFLAIHVAPDAGLEFKQPQLAAGAGVVAMTFGSANAIYFSSSTDQGRTFSKPLKVAEGGPLSLGRHRGPRIAVTPGGFVISAIAGVKGRGADGDLKAWRSADGKTWLGPVTVNDVPDATREGLHAMVSGPDGVLFATWLDLREKGTRLYGSVSRDGGATWSKNVLVYHSAGGTICQCCHPSALIDAHGTIYAMWRNALSGNRDMYLAKSADGGKTFASAEKLGAGSWPLNACPMDGGGLAIGADGKMITVWRRGTAVFLASPGGAETKIEAGKDPALAAGADGIYAVWSTGAALHARVPGKPAPVVLAAEGAYPQLVAVPKGPVLAAWESKGSIQVRVLAP